MQEPYKPLVSEREEIQRIDWFKVVRLPPDYPRFYMRKSRLPEISLQCLRPAVIIDDRKLDNAFCFGPQGMLKTK